MQKDDFCRIVNWYPVLGEHSLQTVFLKLTAEDIKLLADGVTVVSDRYYYSSLAYQGSVLGYDTVAGLNLENPGIRRPDICIFLDLSPEKSLERIGGRGESVEIYENLEKLTAVRAKFLSVVEDLRRDGESIYVVNAARAAEDIAKEIFEIVKKHI